MVRTAASRSILSADEGELSAPFHKLVSYSHSLTVVAPRSESRVSASTLPIRGCNSERVYLPAGKPEVPKVLRFQNHWRGEYARRPGWLLAGETVSRIPAAAIDRHLFRLPHRPGGQGLVHYFYSGADPGCRRTWVPSHIAAPANARNVPLLQPQRRGRRHFCGQNNPGLQPAFQPAWTRGKARPHQGLPAPRK
jgi:hypothetical protein